MSLQDTLEQINSFDINDIDWSRIGVWPLIARVMISVIAVLAVFAAVYFTYIKDMQTELKQEVAREQQLRSKFKARAFEAATLEQHIEIKEKMEQNFKTLVAQLPQKTQVPGLLDDIDEKGRVSGLDIVSIKLLNEIKGEFYMTLPIDVVVKGNYHNLGAFVSGIAGMSRIVTLHDLAITSGGSNQESTGMTVRAHTYRSLGEGDL